MQTHPRNILPVTSPRLTPKHTRLNYPAPRSISPSLANSFKTTFFGHFKEKPMETAVNQQKTRDVVAVTQREPPQPRSQTQTLEPITYRHWPEQPGWGLERKHIVDTHPSSIPQQLKPHVRVHDKKQQSKFIFGTGYIRNNFDAKFNIDASVYQLMNTSGQRAAIKTMDLAMTHDLPKMETSRMASTFCSNPFSPHVQGNKSDTWYQKQAFRVMGNVRVHQQRVRS